MNISIALDKIPGTVFGLPKYVTGIFATHTDIHP